MICMLSGVLSVVDVARDHGTEGGHLWAMEEDGEIIDLRGLFLDSD